MITRIVTAAVLIPLVLGALLWGPKWLFLLIGSIFLAAAIWEYLGIVPHYEAKPLHLSYPLILALPWVWSYPGEYLMAYLVGSCLVLMAAGLTVSREPRMMFNSSALGLLSFFYLGLPFALMGALHPGSEGHPTGGELLLVLTGVWICDSAAYFAGRSLGRHHVTPQISPGKTLEGFACGFLLGGAFVAVMSIRYLDLPIIVGLSLGLVIPLATMGGDLFESALKRGAGIKDTSQLIPGHGGVLDRIDSLLFAVPGYFVVVSFLH